MSLVREKMTQASMIKMLNLSLVLWEKKKTQEPAALSCVLAKVVKVSFLPELFLKNSELISILEILHKIYTIQLIVKPCMSFSCISLMF